MLAVDDAGATPSRSASVVLTGTVAGAEAGAGLAAVRADARGRLVGRSGSWSAPGRRHGCHGAERSRCPGPIAVLTDVAAGTRVLGEHLEKRLRRRGRGRRPWLGWRPMTEAELGPWHERQLRAYAEDNLDRSGGDLVLALERSRRGTSTRLLPDGLRDAGHLARRADRRGRWSRSGTCGCGTTVSPGSRTCTTSRSPRRTGVAGYGRAAMLVAEVLTGGTPATTRLGLHVFGAERRRPRACTGQPRLPGPHARPARPARSAPSAP